MDDRDVIITQQDDTIEQLKNQIRELQKLLIPAVVTPREWQLTAQEYSLFSLLLTRERVSKEQALYAIVQYQKYINPSRKSVSGEKICDVIVHKIRRKLSPYGVEIKNEFGLGWYLVDRKSWQKRLAGSEQDGRV